MQKIFFLFMGSILLQTAAVEVSAQSVTQNLDSYYLKMAEPFTSALSDLKILPHKSQMTRTRSLNWPLFLNYLLPLLCYS
jgi:hypothetical protein